MGKKKLDELFQEKFENFEQVPDDKVWQAIATSLDKKKKRVLPIWWKLGGVAAVLALGLVAINPFGTISDSEPKISNVAQPKADSLNQQDKKQEKILDSKGANQTELVNTDAKNNLENTDDNKTANKPIKNPEVDLKLPPNSNGEKGAQLTAIPEENSNASNPKTLIKNQKTKVVENRNNRQETPKEVLNQMKPSTSGVIAQQDVSKQTVTQKEAEQTVVKNNVQDKTKNGDENLLPAPNEIRIAQDDTAQMIKDTGGDTLANKKKSIYDEIIEQEELAISETQTKNKWSAGPSIAPVYYDAFGQGSPVNSILVPNSKSGNTNLSYGLSVAYEINDRFSVRSGIHKVAYGYETNEIEFSSSLDADFTNQLENIDYADTAGNLVVISNAGVNDFSTNDQPPIALDALGNSSPRSGSLLQQFGYLEVPLELNYALVDKKIGVHVIGGFSSLFLIDNSISLSDGNQTTEVGEANNLNNLNFSTNIGLGVDYKFSPNIKLNIEPVFKYQFNAFDEVDGSFNPFSIGIYSGLTFKF